MRGPAAGAQVRQLCLDIPYHLKAPDGNELDEFLGRKEHPLARIVRDLSDPSVVRPRARVSA